MNAPPNVFLDSILSQWRASEGALLINATSARILPNDERKTLGIEVDGPRYIASIQVWEHACCLDIVVMEKVSSTSTWICGGPCASFAEAHSRLRQLTELLLS